MNNLTSMLNSGEHYFGSGGYNTKQFNDFFEDFKKSFTNQLKRVYATDIEFSKGHFGLSGFFTVLGEWYYFSLSDVRQNFNPRYGDEPQLLIRTAKSNTDYSGGMNRYVDIKNGMFRSIARMFKFDFNEIPKGKRKSTQEIVEMILEKGVLERSFTSMRKANDVAFKLGSKLGEHISVTTWKLGRWLRRSEYKGDLFSFDYDADTKRAIFILNKITDDQLINGLKLGESEVRVNPFTSHSERLEPLAVALYDKIKLWEKSRNTDLFHQALNIFRAKYSEQYYTLLD